MKILVTGGAGFIGSHTVVELFHAGFEPVIVDNFSNSDPSVLERLNKILGHPVKCYNQDCSNANDLSQIISEEQIEGVIHFAAFKSVGESVVNPLTYYSNNIGSLVILLETMLKNKVKNLVFSSSCTVYGQPDVVPVTENTVRKPATSPYGNTKVVCEDIIRDTIASKVPIKGISLRYFNPVGAHDSGLIGELPLGVPGNLVPFITQTAAGIREKLTLYGSDYNTIDGTCVRDFIHVADLAKAHVAALNLLKKQPVDNFYEVFNIGTGKGTSVLELIETFEKVNELKLNYVIGPRRPGDIEIIYGNVDKANKMLHWQALNTLEKSLRDAWRWETKLNC
jgi:UDP-glucose 4-epimerase